MKLLLAEIFFVVKSASQIIICMTICLGSGHSTEQKNPRGGGGETPNAEVIGILIRNFFLENDKKYPNFDI